MEKWKDGGGDGRRGRRGEERWGKMDRGENGRLFLCRRVRRTALLPLPRGSSRLCEFICACVWLLKRVCVTTPTAMALILCVTGPKYKDPLPANTRFLKKQNKKPHLARDLKKGSLG